MSISLHSGHEKLKPPMANLRLISFFLIATSALAAPAKTHHPPRRVSRTRAYIEASCRHTRFPKPCVNYLASYAKVANVTIQTPQALAEAALLVSLYRAVTARQFLVKVAEEFGPVRDCLDQINMSVDELYMAIGEMKRFARETRRDALEWRVSNVETWVGSALTGASGCVDGISGGRRMSKVKATVRGKVQNVAEVTSNALALFHRFASRFH